MLAATDAGMGGEGSCGGAWHHSSVQPHSMGGVKGESGGTHTHTHTGTYTGTYTRTYTRMLHLPFSNLPFKKSSKMAFSMS